MLSDSPPERDVIWTEAGVEGAHRFVQRVWRLVSEAAPYIDGVAPAAADGEFAAVSRAAHKILKGVGEDIERLHFNKAVARLYELTNVLSPQVQEMADAKADRAGRNGAVRQALEFLTVMVAPMMPHLAEECWVALGGQGLAAEQPWPIFEPALTVENEVTYPVQVNGKKRGDLTIARDADQGEIEKTVLALDFVQKALEGKAPRKVIIVPQRIVNVVA
jgi:leucyl-tRNA synthetase